MTLEEINKKIASLNKLLDKPEVPPQDKDSARAKIAALEEEARKLTPKLPKGKKQPKSEIPSEAKLNAFFADLAENKYELNLPFHASIPQNEIDEIASDLANEAVSHFNLADSSEIKKSASNWLKKANSEAEKQAKLQGRAPMTDERAAKAVSDCEEVSKASKPRTPRPPAPKKQFGTRLLDGIVGDTKKAIQERVKSEGGKASIDKDKFGEIKKDISTVRDSAKSFLKALKILAGEKASSSLVERLESSIEEILKDIEPEPEKK